MPSNSHHEAQAFRALLRKKMHRLLEQFALGTVSREQFHLLYERYNARLEIAEHALMSGNPDAIAIAQTGPSTLQIIEETRARAVGIVIYHSKTGDLIETLGAFDVPAGKLQPILRHYLPARALTTDDSETIHKIDDTHWLLFSLGGYTTVITQFRNEPSKQQMQEIRRLHSDFEEANLNAFAQSVPDGGTLAYPFLVFVQKKFKK